MALTPEEIERYKRHLVLREVGGQGQQKLKAAKVLVIGAGGLGSPVLMYLAAAGVGTIGIIDDDRVSLDNLQRQIVHDTPHVGAAKVESAARDDRAGSTRTCASRPTTCGSMPATRSTSSRATTSSPTAPTISPPAISSAMPAISPSSRWCLPPSARSTATSRPSSRTRSGPDGKPYPSYRCIFPEAPPPGTVANCAEVGVLGAAVGVIGTLQATEVLKEIVGHRREPGRPAAALRCAGDALHRDQDRLGPGQSALGHSADHPRSVDPCGRAAGRSVRGLRGRREAGGTWRSAASCSTRTARVIDYWRTWVPINREAALYAAGGDRAVADELLRLGGHDPATDRVTPGSALAAGRLRRHRRGVRRASAGRARRPAGRRHRAHLLPRRRQALGADRGRARQRWSS